MTSKRGQEIEQFYWLIINLLGKVFGYLMLIAGVLFVLGFVSELVRTDVMSWNGQKLSEWSQQWPVLLGGSVVTLFGGLLVYYLPVKKRSSASAVNDS